MYEVVKDLQKNHEKSIVKLYVVEIKDLKNAINKTYEVIKDTGWVDKLTDLALKKSFAERAQKTIAALYDCFHEATKLNKSIGEYLVSITSKEVIVHELKYKDIPLGEVIGKRTTGNGGFDYYSENPTEKYIIFGEAKYRKGKSAYKEALNQIITFIEKEKDIEDYADIIHFVESASGENLIQGIKAFSGGFSLTDKEAISFDTIEQNERYKELLKYKELILIGVKIDEK